MPTDAHVPPDAPEGFTVRAAARSAALGRHRPRRRGNLAQVVLCFGSCVLSLYRPHPLRRVPIHCLYGLRLVLPPHDIRDCWALHALANPLYLRRFLFPALPCVAPYRVRGGVKVVSMTPSYPRDTVVHAWLLSATSGKPYLVR